MENAVKRILAINGPYPPTFDGIRNAIEECRRDQELGETEVNNKLVVVREDGTKEEILISDSGEGAYEAADIAHNLGIPHDSSFCWRCVSEKRAAALIP